MEGTDRKIQIKGNAYESVIISGDENSVHIYHGSARITEEKKQPPPPIGPNPYMGLAAFTEADADRFFGREELIRSLRESYEGLHTPASAAVPSPRLLAVLGPSGSGKSSVAQAGLIPELARNPLPGVKETRVAVFTPGHRPLEALSTILARIVTADPAPLKKAEEFKEAMEKQNDKGEWDGLRRIGDIIQDIDDSPLLILVDQFEEVFSLCEDQNECLRFIENLLHAASDGSRHLSVVITLRSDFLSQTQTQQLAHLSNAIADNHILVPAMTRENLRMAIAEPARQAMHPLDDAVVELLIQQTESHEGALPLLEFALAGIWEGMARGVPPAKTLESLGGVGGALAKEARKLFNGLSESDQLIAKRAFLKLVQLGEGVKDARRRVHLSEIAAGKESLEQVRRVVQVFSSRNARLITLSADPESENAEVAEITHEALFEHWEMLSGWIDQNREDIRFERRLAQTAGAWNSNNRPKGSLWWQSPDLNHLKDYHERHDEDMSSVQLAFHNESVKRARQSNFQRRLIVGILTGLTIVSVFLAIRAWKSQNTANRALEKAEIQKELALSALNTLTYEFVDELNNLPRTQPILEKILNSNADLLEKIYELNPDTSSAQREQSVNLNRLGDLQIQIGNTEAALKAYEKAMEISKTLAKEDPENKQAQRDLSISYNKLGDLQIQIGNTEAALKAYEKAMEISKTLAKEDPENKQAQRDLSISYNKLGDLQIQIGNTEAALKAYEKAMEISKTLAKEDPENKQAQRDLSISYNKLGDLQIQIGNTEAALKAYEKAMEISKTLAKEDPENKQAQRDLLVSYYNFGMLYLNSDKKAQALTSFQTALEISETLAQDSRNAQARRDRSILENRVKKLSSSQ